jgi:hypothetical protein
MVNDSRTEVQDKTIDYSYKVFQELIGPDHELTFEENADNPKVIGREYDVAVFENIYKCALYSMAYFKKEDLECLKKSGMNSISRMIH